MASLALFDLAGTLTDPIPGLVSSHRSVLADIGLDFDALAEAQSADVSQLVRSPVPDIYKRLGVPEEQTSEAFQQFKQRSVLAGIAEDALFPGVDDLLLALLDKGWKLGVATNQLQAVTERTIDNLGISNRFEFVAGTVAPRTSEGVHMVVSQEIAKFDTEPDGIAMTGDRVVDIQLAKKLGATGIGAGWGFGSIEELMGADADAIAMAPADVIELLVGGS